MKMAGLKSESLLLTSAVIWGFAFVAQRAGMEHVGPYIFNGIRFGLGALALLPFTLRSLRKGDSAGGRKVLIVGAIAGTILFFGASLQQTGLVYTTAGKAGFITGLYVVLVPILGLPIGVKTGLGTWLGILLAAVGLYLLSFTGGFSISPGDLMVLGGTFFWASHVLLIGAMTSRFNPLVLATAQFCTCSLLSLAAAALFEPVTMSGIRGAAIPILYGGFLSVGIAYTLQVFAQRNTPPSHAAIILGLETVFAALGGWVVLDEVIPPRGLVGCAFILAGIVLSQSFVKTGKPAVA